MRGDQAEGKGLRKKPQEEMLLWLLELQEDISAAHPGNCSSSRCQRLVHKKPGFPWGLQEWETPVCVCVTLCHE